MVLLAPIFHSRKHHAQAHLVRDAIAAAASVPAFAQKPDAAAEKVTETTPGKGTITNTAKITASVEAIDSAARTVTLKGPRGKVVTLAVGPEVKNFAQMKVGDMVVVRYAEALSLELKKGGKELRQRSEREASETAQPGERPGAAAGRQITVIADVTAVDRKKHDRDIARPEKDGRAEAARSRAGQAGEGR